VVKRVPHPKYADRLGNPDNSAAIDIAIFQVNKPFQKSKIADLASSFPVGAAEMFVAGYGVKENDRSTNQLKIATVSNPVTYSTHFGLSRFIESSFGSGSLCPADSGGPGFIGSQLVGVASESLDMGGNRECRKANRVRHDVTP
jgi:hypothetical protein